MWKGDDVGLIKSKRETETPVAERARPSEPGVDSLIASGTVLDGNCETSGALRVDGHITGDVRAHRLTVGRDGRIGGAVAGPNGSPAGGGVVIDGRVDGTVSAPQVEVGASGAVGGGMRADEAVIRGRVAGAIVAARRLRLEATAEVDGDVTAPRVGLEEGARVFGTIRIGERGEPGKEPGRRSGPG